MNVTELNIEGSKIKPSISFRKGKIDIVGRSIQPNAGEWFYPLFQALSQYSSNPHELTEVNIQLDYLNSDSNRSLMNILVLIEKIQSRGKKVIVRWYYKKNDHVMLEQGNIFQSLFEVPFSFETINT
jgi:hypothetical protein